jgi:hypothetical protein
MRWTMEKFGVQRWKIQEGKRKVRQWPEKPGCEDGMDRCVKEV